MNSEWAEHSVGDLFELINGYAFKSSDFKKCGIPVIKIKNVKAGAFIDDNFDFVDPDFLISRSDKQPKQGDLLITMSGNRHDGSRETWVGKVTWFNQGKNYLVNQRVGILRLRDSGGFNARFLAYQLSSDAFQDHFIAVATSSGGQANLSPNQIKEMILRVPGKKIQDQIATILGEIEDKIDLNRRINQTLEAMAQAIFKSWFVDFDPVKARIAAIEQGEDPQQAAMRAISGKTDAELDQMPRRHHDQLAATAALFPDAMEESELGEIPKGWDVKRIGDMIELAYGKALKSTDRQEGSVPVYGSGGITGYHNEALVPHGAIIVGRKGTVGSLYWEDEPFFPIDTTFYVKPKAVPMTYCFYVMKTLGLDKMNTDAAVPGLNRENVYRLELVNPSTSVLNAFDRLVSRIREAMRANETSSQSLAELRDTLLPKLLSGDISVETLMNEVAQ